MTKLAYSWYVFDLDGTLGNSFPFTLKNHNAIAQQMGLQPTTEERVLKNLHLTWDEFIIALFGPKVDVTEFKANFDLAGFDKIPIPKFPGALEVIQVLKEMKKSTAILSNRDKKTLKSGLKQTGFNEELFDFIQPLENLGKPNPCIFDKLKARINGQKAVYVGDAIVDYQAANGAGLDFFAVLTGVYSAKDFLRAGLSPGMILPSVKDLLYLL